jgi:hypothetical protein
MRNKIFAVLVAIMTTVALSIAWPAPKASALSTPLGRVRTYTVTCATTATRVVATANQPAASVLLWNNSATAAYLGGADVAATVTGMPICTSTSCVSASVNIDARDLHCMSAGGAVTLLVLAGAL